MISTAHLSDLFVEVADTLIDEFDLVLFLQRLTDHVAVISEAESVGLMLADHGGALRFMAASNESAEMLDLLQLQSDEGPCLDCFRSGEPVINAHLDSSQERWPVFTAAAVQSGFTSVHAFPMRLRSTVIGTINAFSGADTALTDEECRVVQSLADIATIALLQERTISRAEALSEQLQVALDSRIVIEQAKGALARLEGVSVEQAFEILRSRARITRRRLVEVAADVLEQS